MADLLARADARPKLARAEATWRLRAVLGPAAPIPGRPGWAKAADAALYHAYQEALGCDGKALPVERG